MTAQSDLIYSHAGNVTRINWLSPYHKVTKTGQVKQVEEDEPRTMQFCTSSIDGYMMFWDLFGSFPSRGDYRPTRKLRRLKVRPSALTVDISPFRSINRLFRPHYKIHIFTPKKHRSLPMASSDFISANIDYEKVNPQQQDSMTERVIYKPVMVNDDLPEKRIYCGSSFGYVCSATWSGYVLNYFFEESYCDI